MAARITCLVLIAFLLSGCKYTFTEELEIEEQILKITALGITSEEVRALADKHFGAEAFFGHGVAEKTQEGWVLAAWFPNPLKRNGAGPYCFVYKLGSHPSPYVVIPTHVYAYWFFDNSDHLVQVRAKKEIDGI